MSSWITAIISGCLTTGIFSVFVHAITQLCGAAFAVGFAVLCALHQKGRIHVEFFLAAIVLTILCMLSSEVNIAPQPSTIHLLACYGALAGLAGTNSDYSPYAQRTIIVTNLILVTLVFAQTLNSGVIQTWNVTGIGSGANLVAAQINMTLPLIALMALQATGFRRFLLTLYSLAGGFAVVCVGSRNGIGSLAIMLVLFGLFNHKKIAVITTIILSLLLAFLDEVMQNSLILDILVRFRFARFEAKNTRSLIWSISEEYIMKSPWFGVGPGKAGDILAVIDVKHAHSNYVQIALECGLPAALIFCLIMGMLLKLPAIAILKNREAFILSLSVVGYFLYSLTDNPIHHPQATLLLVVCVHEARRVLQLTDSRYCSPQLSPFHSPSTSGRYVSGYPTASSS